MKLNDKVRNIQMLENIPTIYDELRTCLTKNFKPTRTASSLHSEIRDMKQKGNVLNYRDKLSSLIAELTLLPVSELGESPNEVARSTIKMMNGKLALETFQKGLHENIRIAVIAAQPKSLTQAYEIASTQEQSLQSSKSANSFYANRNQYKNNKNNYQNHNHNKYNSNTNFRNKNNQNFYRNAPNYRNNNQQHNRNPTNSNTRNNGGRNFNNNSNYRNRQANIHTIHNQGNDLAPGIRIESPGREN